MFVPSAWSKTLLAVEKLFVKLKIFECQKKPNLSSFLIKVSKYQKQISKFSFKPKNEQFFVYLPLK